MRADSTVRKQWGERELCCVHMEFGQKRTRFKLYAHLVRAGRGPGAFFMEVTSGYHLEDGCAADRRG